MEETIADATADFELDVEEADTGAVSTETMLEDVSLDLDDDDLGDLDDVDEVATKLDLARAYLDMGDSEGTRSILDEVIAEGSEAQKQEAEQLLSQL